MIVDSVKKSYLAEYIWEMYKYIMVCGKVRI